MHIFYFVYVGEIFDLHENKGIAKWNTIGPKLVTPAKWQSNFQNWYKDDSQRQN